MKDFYDVYIFLQNNDFLINIDTFEIAFLNTIKRRNSWNYINDYKSILDSITKYERIHHLWNGYTKKNRYAHGIDLDNIVNALNTFLNKLILLMKQ